VHLEGLGKAKKEKNSMTSSRIEPATYWLVAWHLNQLCYHVSQVWEYSVIDVSNVNMLCMDQR
jgi:hypothetical protein